MPSDFWGSYRIAPGDTGGTTLVMGVVLRSAGVSYICVFDPVLYLQSPLYLFFVSMKWVLLQKTQEIIWGHGPLQTYRKSTQLRGMCEQARRDGEAPIGVGGHGSWLAYLLTNMHMGEPKEGRASEIIFLQMKLSHVASVITKLFYYHIPFLLPSCIALSLLMCFGKSKQFQNVEDFWQKFSYFRLLRKVQYGWEVSGRCKNTSMEPPKCQPPWFITTFLISPFSG